MEKKKWISEQLCIAEASFTCNLYCKYCHNPPIGQKNPNKYIIEKVKKIQPKAVSLEGQGEPLTNPKIFDLIKDLRKNGVEHIMISTNAVALHDIKLCEKIVKEVEFLVINFPSHIKEIYNSLTRSTKYDLTIQALSNLKKLNALNKVRIFYIITKENYKTMIDFPLWLKKNYPEIFMINFTFVRNEGRVNNNKDILPTYNEVAPYVKLALLKAKLNFFKVVIQNMPLCALNKVEGFSFEFHRYKRGDNVLESGIKEKVKNEKCLKCSLEKACCGAREDYIKVYGDKELKSSKIKISEIKEEKF